MIQPLLAVRLREQGLPDGMPVILHANRRVLVSLTRRGALRVHQGYEAAPDEVVAAIARWARPRTRRADRRLAQRILVAFPVHSPGRLEPGEGGIPREGSSFATPRPTSPNPEDLPALHRLEALHADLNARHFGSALGAARIRISRRMRRRLGEFRPAPAEGELSEIAIGWRHIRRDGWDRTAGTLLHEMVHQWQAETGRRLGHGREFRAKCAELGISGRAMARLGIDFRSYLSPEE